VQSPTAGLCSLQPPWGAAWARKSAPKAAHRRSADSRGWTWPTSARAHIRRHGTRAELRPSRGETVGQRGGPHIRSRSPHARAENTGSYIFTIYRRPCSWLAGANLRGILSMGGRGLQSPGRPPRLDLLQEGMRRETAIAARRGPDFGRRVCPDLNRRGAPRTKRRPHLCSLSQSQISLLCAMMSRD
jgi:hypothetical protein